MIHFLFSANPSRHTVVESMFSDQFDAVRSAGYSSSVLPEAAIAHKKSLRNIPTGAKVIYRGWMLKPAEYEFVTLAIKQALAHPFTSSLEYVAAHYLPNWYTLIKEDTPPTRILPVTADFDAELKPLEWHKFFVKDYVKSLKTARGSIVDDPSQIATLIAEMEHFRGDIEGGICVRKVEPFIIDSERRYFVVDGRGFSAGGDPVPDLVRRVAARIPSRFISVDVVRRDDGVLRVVEVGDGQVSDLVGWTAEQFLNMWTIARPPHSEPQ